ncbi:MAG TPA: hypothetical protein VJM53_05360, partial [Burkholderiales bacterium]|nr:hypothetical protein [Burkholderiales bacterium]
MNRKSPRFISFSLATLMLVASGAATLLRPDFASTSPVIGLASLIPEQIGEWNLEHTPLIQV